MSHRPGGAAVAMPAQRSSPDHRTRLLALLLVGSVLLVATLVTGALRSPLPRGSALPHAAHDRMLAARTMAAPVGPPPRIEPLIVQQGIDRAQAFAINAGVPFAKGPIPAAAAFRFQGDADARGRAESCLAAAQWYEAGDDEVEQRAVAQVVLNRARHPAFPHSVCGVVFQGSERVTGCQFTFTCDGALARRPLDWQWKRSIGVARAMLDGAVYAPVGFATHYHTDWVVPYWSSSLDKIAAVKTHLFFRWKGGWGTPPAFRSAADPQEPLVPKLAMLSAIHDGAPSLNGDLPVLDDGVAGQISGLATVTGEAQAGPRTDDLRGIDLKGSKLLLSHPDGGAYGLALASGAPSGSYALTALGICKGKPYCKVMGWIDGNDVPKRFPVGTPAQKTMAFLYIHDGRSGQELLKWDCAQIKRPDASQCMNKAAPAGGSLSGEATVNRLSATKAPVPAKVDF